MAATKATFVILTDQIAQNGGLISPANGQRNSEDQAVRKVIADFVEAINRSDIKAFGALFTDDADFVVITGKLTYSELP